MRTTVTIVVPDHVTLEHVQHCLGDWPVQQGVSDIPGYAEYSFCPDEGVYRDSIVAWFGPQARIESIAPAEMED